MASRPKSAVWLVNKPAGVTSASLVDEFRARHQGNWTLKVMHGGVLDPFAHGLVVLLVGAATKLFERLHDAPKTYVATVKWGRATDTGDGGGRVVAEGPVPGIAEQNAALSRFLGWTDQVPPATSNKRVDGERAYVRAHRGETVVLPPSKVFLSSASWRGDGVGDERTLELCVRGGFYVRSLVRDLGETLGTAAHVTTLERPSLGPWQTPVSPTELTGADVLPWLPSLTLTDAELGTLRHELRPLTRASTKATWALPDGFPVPPHTRLFHQGRLVGLQTSTDVTLLPGGI